MPSRTTASLGRTDDWKREGRDSYSSGRRVYSCFCAHGVPIRHAWRPFSCGGAIVANPQRTPTRHCPRLAVPRTPQWATKHCAHEFVFHAPTEDPIENANWVYARVDVVVAPTRVASRMEEERGATAEVELPPPGQSTFATRWVMSPTRED